jgi:hypothetical protein
MIICNKKILLLTEVQIEIVFKSVQQKYNNCIFSLNTSSLLIFLRSRLAPMSTST